MILELTPAMAEQARFIDAGEADLFNRLTAKSAARRSGQVLVRTYTRRK